MASPLDWINADDLPLVLNTRANVLLIGHPDETLEVVKALIPCLSPPIARSAAGGFAVPAVRGGTLILNDLEELSRADQQRLQRWLVESNGTMRVISTASAPLFDLVRQKAFPDILYYRLNTVCVAVARP